MSASGEPIGKGILWSDRRGVAEASILTERLGGEDINRARTGVPSTPGAVAAKLAWLSEHEPGRLAACEVILSARDFVLRRMTDEVVTDVTFASRSGLYDFDGNAVRELAGPVLGKLPSVVPSDTVIGPLKPVPGAELGLRPGIPVVIGAGTASARYSARVLRKSARWSVGAPRPTCRSRCTSGRSPRRPGRW